MPSSERDRDRDGDVERKTPSPRGATPTHGASWPPAPLPAVPPSAAGALGHHAAAGGGRDRAAVTATAPVVQDERTDPRTTSMAGFATEAAPRVSLLRQIAAAQVPAADPAPATPTPAASSAAASSPADPAQATPPRRPGHTPSGSASAQPRAEATRPAKRRNPLRPAGTRAVPKLSPPEAGTAPVGGPATAPVADSPYALHTDRGTTAVPQEAHPQARKLLARMLEDDAPPTVSFNIVDRLIGSPYASAVRSQEVVRTQELTEATARPILLFTLDLAETMFRWGAGALDVETSVIAVTTSLGLRHVDVDVTNQSVHLNWAPPEGLPVSILRVVRSSSDNFAGLTLVHQLVGDIAAGRADHEEARTRLRSIRRRHKPYAKPLVVAAGGLFAGLFVLVIGGTFAGAAAAVLPAVIAEMLVRLTERWRIPTFFSVAMATFVSTMIALVLYGADLIGDPATVVAGGIMLLLPSGRFVSAVQDAINGFPVTAVGRLFSALIVYAGIITGVMLGAVIAVWVHLPSLSAEDLTRAPSGLTLPLWLLCLLIAVAVPCGGMVQQVALRHLPLIAGIAIIGYLVSWVSIHWFHAGSRLAPAVAATAMGLLARWIGLRVGTPPLVLAVPAIVILLPGLSIFRSMYAMALDAADVTSGLVGMFTSFTVIMGIAAGVALGDTLARPFTRDWNSRKRIRRR